MAIIRVEMGKRDQDERDAIIEELTDVMVKHGSPLENTHVILYEVDYDVWAKGGKTYTKRAGGKNPHAARAAEAPAPE